MHPLRTMLLILLTVLLINPGWSQQPQNTGLFAGDAKLLGVVPLDELLRLAGEQVESQKSTTPISSGEQTSPSDQSSVKTAPNIINVTPPPNGDAERHDQAVEREEKAKLDRRLVELTGDLAFFTAGLFYATGALFVATLMLAAFGFMQTRDTKHAIAAARQSNEISRDALVADQRAWVSVGDLQVESDLVPVKAGAEIHVSVRIKNVGRTPAIRVHTDMTVISGYENAPNEAKAISEKNRTVDEVHITRTLLPGESYRRKWAFMISQAYPNSPLAFPVIVGCTTYRITPDNSVHQTAFVFDLFICPPGAPSDFLEVIRLDKVPLSRDRIGTSGSAGGFAD